MKISFTLFLLASSATAAWSQTAPASPAPSPSPTTPTTQLQVRGPDAIAEKEPSRVVGTINGKQVTAKEAADLLKLVPEAQKRSVPNLQTLVERLYLVNDLAGQAAKDGLDQQSPWKEQIKMDRDNILAQAYMGRLTNAGAQAGGDDPKQYYDAHQDQFDIAKLSGIVVGFNPPGTPASTGGVNRTEQQAHDKADDLERKIKAGADIASLARTDSDNQQSAAKGGDLGTLSAGSPNVPPDLKSVVFGKLQAGQVSEPIRAGNAFYIIKVESRTKEAFDQAKPEIMQKLQSDKSQAILKQELDKYKIQGADPEFFATSTAAAPKIPSLASPSSASPSSNSGTAKPPVQH